MMLNGIDAFEQLQRIEEICSVEREELLRDQNQIFKSRKRLQRNLLIVEWFRKVLDQNIF